MYWLHLDRVAMIRLVFSLVVVWVVAAKGALADEPSAPCGDEVACVTQRGEYYAYLPANRDPGKPIGAIFYLHGHKGKAVDAIRNKGFRSMADELGVAFVALQGVGGTWSFPNAPRNVRNEPKFFDSVIADVVTQFRIDRSRIMLSGFSAGAFMTWYSACENSKRFAGYAPIAGAFWKPLPDFCRTEFPYLYHVHGVADRVVPLQGRSLGDGRFHQGDVFDSFEVWLKAIGQNREDAQSYADGPLACRLWTPMGREMELCLHGGGHTVNAAWIRRAWLKLAKARHWD